MVIGLLFHECEGNTSQLSRQYDEDLNGLETAIDVALVAVDPVRLSSCGHGGVVEQSSEFRVALFGDPAAAVLLKGAMYDKPLVSTEIGTGTSYINIDGETGFVVPPGDSKNLR